MQKKVYISGKITGLVYEEAFENFKKAEDYLKGKGYEVVNPMTIEHNHDKSWENYMKVDLIEMLKCDAVYFMKGFFNSKGARMEFDIAERLKIELMFEN
jgi:hypothetical protein